MKTARFIIAAALLLSCLLFVSCNKVTPQIRDISEIETPTAPVAKEEICLNVTEINTTTGKTVKLVATITPVPSYLPVFHFDSTDESVATVDESGLVTAVGVGRCAITVITEGKVLTKICRVNVTDPSGEPTTETPTEAPTTDTPPTDTPPTDTPPTVTPSTDTPVAPTDTPVIPTDTPVIPTDTPVIPTDTPVIPTDTPVVPTDTPIVEYIPIERLELVCPTLYMGSSFVIKANVYPENATETYSFYCSDDRYLNLSEDGNVDVGWCDGMNVMIRVISDDGGVEDAKSVPITFPASFMRLDTNETLQSYGTYNLTVGQSLDLRCVFKPDGRGYSSINWINEKSFGGGINISLDPDGNTCTVTAVNPGKAGVTAYFSLNGEASHTRTVFFNVIEAPKPKINITDTDLRLTVGDTHKLNVTTENYSSTLSYLSQNPDIVRIDADGRITALSAGTATVTVATSDLSVKQNCTVTVVNAPLIVLESEELVMQIGQTLPVGAVLKDSDGTLSYSSADDTVALVSDGNVTAVAAGETTITVTLEGSTLSASLKVTVTDAPEETETPAETEEPPEEPAVTPVDEPIVTPVEEPVEEPAE